MSRGEFGAEVGTPRLLELYDRFNVTTSWFTPGHTVDTFPDTCRRIRDAGHEFGNHGYYHENPTKISAAGRCAGNRATSPARQAGSSRSRSAGTWTTSRHLAM
jgi:hypothetical protein